MIYTSTIWALHITDDELEIFLKKIFPDSDFTIHLLIKNWEYKTPRELTDVPFNCLHIYFQK